MNTLSFQNENFSKKTHVKLKILFHSVGLVCVYLNVSIFTVAGFLSFITLNEVIVEILQRNLASCSVFPKKIPNFGQIRNSYVICLSSSALSLVGGW